MVRGNPQPNVAATQSYPSRIAHTITASNLNPGSHGACGISVELGRDGVSVVPPPRDQDPSITQQSSSVRIPVGLDRIGG